MCVAECNFWAVVPIYLAGIGGIQETADFGPGFVYIAHLREFVKF